jgi:hypothetical protein
MLMEDAMTNTDKLTECMKPVVVAQYLDDANSLYVLVISLLATLISLPAVLWVASSGFVA